MIWDFEGRAYVLLLRTLRNTDGARQVLGETMRIVDENTKLLPTAEMLFRTARTRARRGAKCHKQGKSGVTTVRSELAWRLR